MGHITRKIIIQQLYKHGLDDIVKKIIALTDGDVPKPSNPETYIPSEKPNNLTMEKVSEEPDKKLFSSKIACTCTMEIEVEATDKDNAFILAPGVAYDIIEKDILPILNEKFSSFNFRFNDFKPLYIKEV